MMTRAEAAAKAGRVTSALKASVVRRNGRQPCAPGKVRGRRWTYPHFCSSIKKEVRRAAGTCPDCGGTVERKGGAK